ncbi:MAG: nucleotidyltransferase domain-containing protein [Planctomycetes bacterium]|nr:nucleotidyltransferase domain-containing protein [Planctomycetota bacterium]
MARKTVKGVDSILSEIVRRIRSVCDPDRIILFGSRARGDDRSSSDIDVLIVAPSTLPRGRRTVPVYTTLAGIGVAKDVFWWTPQEIQEWRGVRSHFINRVLSDGRVLYEKPA